MMRKHFLILFILISLSFRTFSQVEISIDCQDNWGPGRYNKVTVRINFGAEKGFARFTQDFPVGINVFSDSLPSGDFSWRDNQLNVVWINLPEKNQLSFSYYIFPDKSMNGNIEINGKVAIMEGGNSKKTFSMAVKPVLIGGLNGTLPEEMKTKSRSEIVTNVTKNETRFKEVNSPEESEMVYRVQVSVSSVKMSGDELKRKLGIDKSEKVTVVKTGNVYKYHVGECSDPECANDLLRRLVAKGIKDAFVVAYRNGEQILKVKQ